MGAVTYPDSSVSAELSDRFVPVQVDVEQAPKLVDRFGVVWTPNFNVLDAREKMCLHLEGWLPPAEFLSMLRLAQGHHLLHRKRPGEAAQAFQSLIDRHPQSEFAPEACYYIAVSRYLDSHQAEALTQGWKTLQTLYPDSVWAARSKVV